MIYLEDSEIFPRHLNDLSRRDTSAMFMAEWSQVTWLKGRVASNEGFDDLAQWSVTAFR